MSIILQVGAQQLIETGTSIYRDLGSAAFTVFIVILIIYFSNKNMEKERNMWLAKIESKENRIDQLHTCHATDLRNVLSQVQETIAKFNQTLLEIKNLMQIISK
jgi:hypothetical protein